TVAGQFEDADVDH
nr:Chain D, PBM peptide [Homo sapiens]